MIELGKWLLSSRFVQVPDTPTNFHCPIMSRSTKLAKALEIPPTPTKRVYLIMSIIYLELVLILPIKFHPDLSTLSIFQDVLFPRFQFPSNPICPQIQFELKIEHLRFYIFFIYQVSLRSDHLFVRWRYLKFHIFQDFWFPSLTPPPM